MKFFSKEKLAEFKAFFSMDKSTLKKRLRPLSLFSVLIVLDQVTKMLIVNYFELVKFQTMNGPATRTNPRAIELVGDWIKLTHVRNQGAAWSGGDNLEGFFRIMLLIAIPITLLIVFGIWSLFTKELSKIQRWAAAAIMAGGLGNLIDRVFRYADGPHDVMNGVVDFIDMSFFTIPKFTPYGRWPTFNVADASIVIGISLLILTMIISEIKLVKSKKK